MIEFRAAAAQLDTALGDLDGNRRIAVEAIVAAADRGAQLVVLPELASCGYPSGVDPAFMRGFLDCAESVPGPFTDALSGAAAEHRVHVVAGMLERHPALAAGMWNSVVLVSPDGGVRVQHKLHLPREEKRYFFHGDRLEPIDTTLGRLGLLVCADNSFPETSRLLALRGAEVICVVYAAKRMANPAQYRWLVATRAYENQIYMVAANRIGSMSEGEFCGRSTIAAPDGSVLDTLEEEDGLALAVLDPELLLSERLRQTRYRDRRPPLYAALADRGQ